MLRMDTPASRLKDTACIVLTENYFLYYGLARLFSHIDFYQVHYDGSSVHDWKSMANKKHVAVIIDGRIFIVGAWHGFKAIMSVCPLTSRIWLPLWENWSMWPYGCSRDKVISPRQHVATIARKIASVLSGDASNHYVLHHPALTNKEKAFLGYYLRGGEISSLAKKMATSEKRAYSQRYAIQSKFGFPVAAWMFFICDRNKVIFNRRWFCSLNENQCQCKRCRLILMPGKK